jgi:hypothetical protein
MTMTQDRPYDVNRIRQDAHQSINQGAVTEDYSLDRDRVLQYLNEVLASELMCVLRYRHHQIVAKGINYPQNPRSKPVVFLASDDAYTIGGAKIDVTGGDSAHYT